MHRVNVGMGRLYVWLIRYNMWNGNIMGAVNHTATN
jgi:hypothetical protein